MDAETDNISSNDSDYSSSDDSDEFIISNERSKFPVYSEEEVSSRNMYLDFAPRTKNELVELDVEDIDIVLTPNEKIHKLGFVKNIVGKVAIIEAYNSYPALDIDSLLCLENRTVVGKIVETFGTIDKPHYTFIIPKRKEILDEVTETEKNIPQLDKIENETVQEITIQPVESEESNNPTLTSKESIEANQAYEPGEIVVPNNENEGNKAKYEDKPPIADLIKLNVVLYYVESHSTHVFPEKLYSKGYDASDVNDEELSESDQEFSDDEKEAQYKSLKKARKRQKLNDKKQSINATDRKSVV